MININKLKIGDYKLFKRDGIIYIRKGERVLEIDFKGNMYFVSDSLLHQSDCYICETEQELINKIKELCISTN